MAAQDRRELGRVFDEAPALFDRVRPGHPDELFADLAEITGLAEGTAVLEVGCGTGQATRALAAFGCPVTAVEPGGGMAALAPRRMAGVARQRRRPPPGRAGGLRRDRRPPRTVRPFTPQNRGMPELQTVAELATGAGTLVLAAATFASVRSANRAARAAEQSLLENLRPLLLPSRPGDPPEKVGFQDDHWVQVAGGLATAEATDEAVYLTIALRNVGNGLAVLNGWAFTPGRLTGADVPRPDLAGFRRLTRDLYVPPHDVGFWQGALRDPADPLFASVAKVIANREPFTVDLLYGDGEGGQRVVSRFSVIPRQGDAWLPAASRHWHLDRPEPR